MDMSVIQRLNAYLEEMGYHVVISDRDTDIPIVHLNGDKKAATKECAICGRRVGKYITLPNVKRNKQYLKDVTVCLDLQECFGIVRGRKQEQKRRIKDLEDHVQFPI